MSRLILIGCLWSIALPSYAERIQNCKEFTVKEPNKKPQILQKCELDRTSRKPGEQIIVLNKSHYAVASGKVLTLKPYPTVILDKVLKEVKHGFSVISPSEQGSDHWSAAKSVE